MLPLRLLCMFTVFMLDKHWGWFLCLYEYPDLQCSQHYYSKYENSTNRSASQKDQPSQIDRPTPLVGEECTPPAKQNWCYLNRSISGDQDVSACPDGTDGSMAVPLHIHTLSQLSIAHTICRRPWMCVVLTSSSIKMLVNPCVNQQTMPGLTTRQVHGEWISVTSLGYRV